VFGPLLLRGLVDLLLATTRSLGVAIGALAVGGRQVVVDSRIMTRRSVMRCGPWSSASRSQESRAGQPGLAYTLGGRILQAASSGWPGGVAVGRQAGAGIGMEQTYRRYCKAAAVGFLLVTLYMVPTKLLQGRLGHDWAHSVLTVGRRFVVVDHQAASQSAKRIRPSRGSVHMPRVLVCSISASHSSASALRLKLFDRSRPAGSR
jgi:hypothetical protein